LKLLDSRFRGNDESKQFQGFYDAINSCLLQFSSL
jgi:hypothetical protein